MVDTFNYAEKFSPNLLEIVEQEALTSPFLASNIEFTGAKTFHFTANTVSGYKDTNRASNSYNEGSLTQTDKEYTLEHERDISFGVHPSNIDETNLTASIENIAKTFVSTQDVPERDAYFFSKVATLAIAASLKQETTVASWTKDNVYTRLKAIIGKGKLKLYRQKGALILYVASYIMDLLEEATNFTRSIDVVAIAEGGAGIETRITSINGVTIMEVIDDSRFYSAFDFTEGFVADDSAQAINVLAATPITTKMIPKYNEILYAPRDARHPKPTVTFSSFGDVIVFPNGKDGNIDSIYVDLVPASETGI